MRIGVGSFHFSVAVSCTQEHSIKAPLTLSTVSLPQELLLLGFASDSTAGVKLGKINLSFHLILVIKAHEPPWKLWYWSSFSV